MISINTNISSITAQANLSKIQTDFNTAMTRLSSGLRINSAADDAAGMAIGAQMTSQVQGMNMAVSNANQGKNLVNTAESANQGVASMLHRVRELAVQSASDTNTAVDRQALTAEANQLIQEINSVAQNTTWNGMKVLDGSFTGKQLQIGADQGQSLNIDIDSASATKIGANVIRTTAALVSGTTAAVTTGAIAASTKLNVSGHAGSAEVTTVLGESAKDLANAVNAVTASTGVAARATTVASLSNVTGPTTMSFSIGGVSIGTVNISDAGDLTSLRDAINTISGQTGVIASMGATNAEIRLTDATGANIRISGFSANGTGETMDVTALNNDGSLDDAAGANTATLDEAGDTASVVTGQVSLSSTQAFSVASTSSANDGTSFFTAASNSSKLHSVAQVDLSTAKGASEAITVIDTALQKIDQSSSNLGAISNRLDSTISNLTAMSTNVDAAKSIVMDADFAKESTALARSQVLSQAATAMLAQANSSKQNVLSLLK